MERMLGEDEDRLETSEEEATHCAFSVDFFHMTISLVSRVTSQSAKCFSTHCLESGSRQKQ